MPAGGGGVAKPNAQGGRPVGGQKHSGGTEARQTKSHGAKNTSHNLPPFSLAPLGLARYTPGEARSQWESRLFQRGSGFGFGIRGSGFRALCGRFSYTDKLG